MSLVSVTANAPSKSLQGPSQADWEKRKAIISMLYLRKGKTLDEVKTIMAQDYNFYASERMFKFRFKRWKLDKSLQPDEVLAMSRVQTRRKARGIGCDFWKHGRRVSALNLERYLRDHPHVVAQLKKHVSEDAFMKGHIEALLPPHIVVLTPSPSLRVDEDLHSFESLIVDLRNYMSGYTSEDWSHLPGYHTARVEDSEPVPLPLILATANHLSLAITDPNIQGHFDRLYDYLSQDKLNFLDILSVYAGAIGRNQPEFAQVLLDHARDMNVAIKGPSHPMSLLFSEVSNWSNSFDGGNMVTTLLEMTFDNISGVWGEDYLHLNALCGVLRNIGIRIGTGGGNRPWGTSYQLKGWIKYLEAAHDAHDAQVAIRWISYLLPVAELEYVQLGLDVLERHHWRENSLEDDLISNLLNISFSHLRLGKMQRYFELTSETLDAIANRYGDGQRSLQEALREVQNLECILQRLYSVSDSEFEEFGNLVQRAENILFSIKLGVSTAHMASLQLESFEDELWAT